MIVKIDEPLKNWEVIIVKIFTDDFIQELKERYDGKDEARQPKLYKIATLAWGKPIRDKLEHWASAVDEEIVDVFLPKLKHPNKFKHSCNELLTAFCLSQLGYKLTYEPVVQGKSPDFLAERGENKMVIEVFTRDLSDEEKGLESLKDDLVRRLNKINADYGLEISSTRLEQGLSPKLCKEIGKAVENWLIETNPIVGDETSEKGVIIKVIQKDIGIPHANVIIDCRKSEWVDPKGLREQIHKKVKKYGKPIATMGIPFVVAIVPEFITGLTFNSLKNVILGKEFTFLCYVENRHRREIIGTRPVRDEGGLFSQQNYPLSAVLWIEEIDGSIIAREILNPDAHHPITENYFTP